MNTARQLQIAILLIVSLATGIAMIAGTNRSMPASAEASQLPTVTVIAKRMSPQEKAALAQAEQLPTVTVIGKRMNKNLTPAVTA
ncbi:hypothetical protein [Paraherbaspirillum soli]|uniref:Flp pilus assembly protein CpaB n=1 Tax=Paraherbaspirillum soli TaxID=631222 RepID=A0ABW0MAY0_9BURK